MTTEYDLVVLGGGTGGYVGAIRAAQLGLKVAIVEDNKLGGTCLHQGCIPTKALLRSAEIHRQFNKASEFGIEFPDNVFTLNYKKVTERKDNIINQLHSGVNGLMKKNKIDIYYGHGRILGPSIFAPIPGTISIEHDEGENTILVPKNVLIATGSKPRELAGLETNNENILNSDLFLKLVDLPRSVLIVGGGVIGIEFASMLVDFGVEVTVVEAGEAILPSEDRDIVSTVSKMLKQRGVKIYTNAEIIQDTLKSTTEVTLTIKQDKQETELTAEKIIVAVGRAANSDNIGIQNTSIKLENDFILTNEFYQTEESHIYAVGDVIGGNQLAHVASREAIIAVEHMANKNPLPLDRNHIPLCVYSYPEVARVGITEKEAKEQGLSIKIGKFPYSANGKALIYGETDGFIKIITDKKTEDILGIHMIGPQVTNMISEAGLAKVLDANAWEMSQNIHPHPSLAEVIGEAALAVTGMQLHG